MKRQKQFFRNATPGAIPLNRANQGDLPPPVRDLAELLAEIAMKRLKGPAPQNTGKQESLGDQ